MSEIEDLEKALRDNVLIKNDLLDRLKAEHKNGKRDRQDYVNLLKKMEADPFGAKDIAGEANGKDDWGEISSALETLEADFSRRAKVQFYYGTLGVPAGIFATLFAVGLAVYFRIPLTPVVGFGSAIIAALALHGFLILRVHQQASLAAERLAEKRVALLFLRLALGSPNKKQSDRLLASGMSMFLGHHAAATLPLNADDFHAATSQGNADGA